MAKKNKEEIKVDEYLDASYILNRPKNVVSVSPALDMILSGGIPESTVCVFESAPKVGKTTLALKIAAKAQQQYDKTVVYVSVENRLSVKNLRGIKGLDISPEKFKLIASTQGNILTTETNLEKAEKAMVDFPNSIMIFDSLSALSSADEQTKGYGEGYGGIDSRKLEGQFMRRISPKVLVNNIIFIGIAHLNKKIGGMGGSDPKIAEATLFQHDIRLRLKKYFEKSNPSGEWNSGDKTIGQKVEVSCLTSDLGGPGGKCVCWLKYGEGYSDEAELANLALDLALIEKSGSWMKIEKFDIKVQGMADMVDVLTERKEVYDYLLSEIKEMLK